MKRLHLFICLLAISICCNLEAREIHFSKISASEEFKKYTFRDWNMIREKITTEIIRGNNMQDTIDKCSIANKLLLRLSEMELTDKEKENVRVFILAFIKNYFHDKRFIEYVKTLKIDKGDYAYKYVTNPPQMAMLALARLTPNQTDMEHCAREIESLPDCTIKRIYIFNFKEYFKYYTNLADISISYSNVATGNKKEEEGDKTEKPLSELFSKENMKKHLENMPQYVHKPEKIQLEPKRERSTFLRPEEQGESFAPYSLGQLVDKLQQGNRVEQRKAANELWMKFNDKKEKLTPSQEADIKKAVRKYLEISKNDFEEGFLQLQRLWFLAVPGLLENVTDPATFEMSARLLSLMKTDEIISQLEKKANSASNPDDLNKCIFALEYLKHNNSPFFNDRPVMDSKKATEIYNTRIRKLVAELKEKLKNQSKQPQKDGKDEANTFVRERVKPFESEISQTEKKKMDVDFGIKTENGIVMVQSALEIAKKEVFKYKIEYDKTKVDVKLENNIYVITFPLLNPEKMGNKRPDYAAQVEIDAKTGQILQMLGGS